MPDTFIIIFFVVVLAAALTYIIPVGKYDTKEITYTDAKGKEQSRTVVDADSYKMERDARGKPIRKGIPLFKEGGEVGFTNYAFEGLVSGDKWGSAVGLIALLLIVGGAFKIVFRTGAVEVGIMAVLHKAKGAERAVIPVMFVLFSLGGAVIGMGEEAIAFAMIIIPVVIALGYDSITGIFITYVATQVGFATGPVNPFSAMLAQGIAGVPLLSGSLFRWIMWFVFTLAGCVFIYTYAKRIRKNPVISVAYESDAPFREEFQVSRDTPEKFRIGHLLVILTIVGIIAWSIWGVLSRGYWIPELSTLYFILGLVAGIIGVVFKLSDMRINDIALSFKDGAKELLGAALVVGMAKGILLVLGGDSPDQANVLNTILHYSGRALVVLPTALSAWFMYIFQAVFNFFVISASGQAALTMPLLSPLADIVGVTRQVAVLAYQLGDGLTNFIYPTSAVLVAVLGIARLDWVKWIKFQIKFQVILFILASMFIFIAVFIGFK